MRLSRYNSAAALLLVLTAALMIQSKSEALSIVARTAPEFTQTSPEAWLGSQPLKMDDLRGKVVLIDFWTFSCWNCYRSFPWLNNLEKRLADKDFQVIGIHSPEFEHEKDPEAIKSKMVEFELKHPTMIDNDFRFWRNMQNKYWPTFYLIDKRGFIRHVFIGETHKGDRRAQDIEAAINALLSEAS